MRRFQHFHADILRACVARLYGRPIVADDILDAIDAAEEELRHRGVLFAETWNAMEAIGERR